MCGHCAHVGRRCASEFLLEPSVQHGTCNKIKNQDEMWGQYSYIMPTNLGSQKSKVVASPSLGAQPLPPTSLGAGLAALSSEGANLRRSQRALPDPQRTVGCHYYRLA